MQLLDGKMLATKIRSELKEEIKRLAPLEVVRPKGSSGAQVPLETDRPKAIVAMPPAGRSLTGQARARLLTGRGITPGLAVLLIGDDPASHTYVRLKERAAAEIGMHFEKILLPQTIDEELVLVRIDELNRRADIHGILVQLPLPKSLHASRIISAILPEKDADGFHPENIKRFLAGSIRSRAPQGARSTACGRAASNGAGIPTVIPVTTQAIAALLNATHVSLAGKRALILANSAIFADPVKKMLEAQGVTADIVTKKNIPTDIDPTTYDILITARGIPGSVTPTMVKDGAVVIDVGTTRVDDTIRGDVDPLVAKKADWLTPVPGGVGPLTVAYLLKNVVESTKRTARGGTS